MDRPGKYGCQDGCQDLFIKYTVRFSTNRTDGNDIQKFTVTGRTVVKTVVKTMLEFTVRFFYGPYGRKDFYLLSHGYCK